MSFISALQPVDEVNDKPVTKPKNARKPGPRRGLLFEKQAGAQLGECGRQQSCVLPGLSPAVGHRSARLKGPPIFVPVAGQGKMADPAPIGIRRGKVAFLQLGVRDDHGAGRWEPQVGKGAGLGISMRISNPPNVEDVTSVIVPRNSDTRSLMPRRPKCFSSESVNKSGG